MVYFFVAFTPPQQLQHQPLGNFRNKASCRNLAQLLHHIHARQQSRFLTKSALQPVEMETNRWISCTIQGRWGGIGLDYPGPWHGLDEEFERLITLNPAVSRIGHKASVLKFSSVIRLSHIASHDSHVLQPLSLAFLTSLFCHRHKHPQPLGLNLPVAWTLLGERRLNFYRWRHARTINILITSKIRSHLKPRSHQLQHCQHYRALR